jgi:YegS/Rv2252/BmrU family lipid kinase
MENKVHFIVNPVSGNGKRERVIQILKNYPQSSYAIHKTSRADHAFEIARELAKEKDCVITAVGGDGTVNEVGKALVHTGSSMAIVPCGSGNGLARSLKIPLNLEKAVALCFKGTVQKIDTGLINEKRFLGVAGIGFDAHVAWEFSTHVKRGLRSYIEIIRREIKAYSSFECTIEVDGKQIIEQAFLITAANSSQYGNGAIISPLADMHDGLIDITLIKPFSLLQVPRLGINLFTGRLQRSKHVYFTKGKLIKISSNVSEHMIRVHVDGEPVMCERSVIIQADPLSLNVITL